MSRLLVSGSVGRSHKSPIDGWRTRLGISEGCEEIVTRQALRGCFWGCGGPAAASKARAHFLGAPATTRLAWPPHGRPMAALKCPALLQSSRSPAAAMETDTRAEGRTVTLRFPLGL